MHLINSETSNYNFLKCCVYDDGCHLVEFIRNHYGQYLEGTTASTSLLHPFHSQPTVSLAHAADTEPVSQYEVSSFEMSNST
ncbi:unnamed protein product [Rotaria socialis]|uniref:Uncharacterized protein n=1 Tax=Rotaria socialis TaxID=392032 RepID=A0A819XPR4_9BILA|nr:unnamed protein product [Rotaria socialis]CAF4507681.1 unnamed protein product [Rotaria socialis]CAF4565406.1 unnamed protein product [Rotaria socialis]CAF4679441.1 unnamed protein product [Rotaria socialis]